MNININNVVKNYKNNIIERVLYIDISENTIILINIDDNKWNYSIDYSVFIKSLEDKEREVIDYISNNSIISEISISKLEKEKRDRAYEIVCEFYKYNKEPDIFNKKIRNKNIDTICKKFNVSRSTVEGYLKRYWKKGMTKNTLLPNYYLCGGKGKEKSAGILKRGKPSKFEDRGLNVDENIKKIFKKAVNKFYYNFAQNTLKTTYNLMINEYFTYEKINLEGKEEIIIKDRIPTLAQFRYWFNKERNIKKEVSNRFGNRVYQQKYRPILGTVRDNVYGPGQRYQVDSTVADIYLISQFDEKIIGRPNIYFVIDTFSSAIVGVNVTLDNPSWSSASNALINAMSDKVQFCKEFGIEIEEKQWPMKCVPSEILADRGSEWLSNNSESLLGLGITISNTSSYRAELKSIVEQSFRLLNLKTKSLVPGSINQDFQQRGAKNYILDAKLSIKDFTKIVIKCILNHNNKLLSSYSKDIEMLKDEVLPVPNELWNWGVKNITGSLKIINKEELELVLLPRANATVTERGIRFKGIYYSCIKGIEERWFEKARIKGKFNIEVSYNPNNLNNIYIINSDRTSEKCFILSKDSKYRDKCLADIEYIQSKERDLLEGLKREELKRDITLINDIQKIVDEANKRLEGVEFRNKDINGIRENRRLEKEKLNRNYEKDDYLIIEDKFHYEEEDDLELIKSLMKRRNKNDY